jgi:hydrogenase 3 maturation protease
MKIVVCGVGNRMRGDDAVGPMVIDNLRGKTKAMLIDCGEAPESFLGKIEKAKPGMVIIVDAVQMDKSPGSVEPIDVKEITGAVMSSHNIPLTLFLEYIRNRMSCEIIFLGIQPKSTGLDADVSPECGEAVSKAAKIISRLINHE